MRPEEKGFQTNVYVLDHRETYFGGLRSRWIKAFGFIACR